MASKKIILHGKQVTLTTKTERRLFRLVCKERKQNEDLIRFVCELNRDIKNQQELLECLAEHMKKYQVGESTETKDSPSSSKDATDESKDATDEKGSSSDRETEPGEQENAKKRKLSASPDHSDQDENNSKQ